MKALNGLTKELSRRKAGESVLYTFIFGILAHGIILFNKLSWHDDVRNGYMKLATEKPLAMGRWLRVLLSSFVAKFFGGYNLSLPLFHGVVSIFFIGLSAYIVSVIFRIEDRRSKVILCGIMVCFPVVTSIFAYMFTAPYYFLGLFLSVFGVYVVSKEGSKANLLLSSAFICLSMGIYQAFFPVAVSLSVILFFFEIVDGKFSSPSALLRRTAYYIAVAAATVIEYVIISKVIMKLFRLTPVDYEGFSTIGQSGVSAYLHAIKRCYKTFLLIFEDGFENMYPVGIGNIQRIVILLYGISGLMLVCRQFKKDKLQGIFLALMLLCMPVCFNLIFVIAASSPNSIVHTLMLYGQFALYVFVICATKRIAFDKTKFEKAVLKIASVTLIAIMLCHAYFDNACYLKAQMVQQQSISYLTALVANIKSIDGYSDSMPVCFVYTGQKDETITSNNAFSAITIKPYDKKYLCLPHHFFAINMEATLKQWCNFSPKLVSHRKFRDLEEVKQMPSYPEDGSIRIIDDTVIIKW